MLNLRPTDDLLSCMYNELAKKGNKYYVITIYNDDDDNGRISVLFRRWKLCYVYSNGIY
jgi:hypothetical protein